MRNNLQRPTDYACPHDGWYNGNPKLMVENGTWLDYRDRILELEQIGKFSAGTVAQHDALWAQIPVHEQKARRDGVIKDLEFRPVKTKEGKIEMVTTPSDNGHKKKAPQLHRKPKHAMSPGSIVNRPDPFASVQANQQLAGAIPSLSPQQLGPQMPQSPMVPQAHVVPQAVRPQASNPVANAV